MNGICRGLLVIVVVLCILLLLSVAWTARENEWYWGSCIPDLLSRSAQGEPLETIGSPPLWHLGVHDVLVAKAHIVSHPDQSSYHLLFALRRDFPSIYATIPDSTKAAILCAALSTSSEFDDWRRPDPECPLGQVGVALLATGDAASPFLEPLLDDMRLAPRSGSEPAAINTEYGYRVADYAYYYLCLTHGWEPVTHIDPIDRDKEIDSLKARLREHR
jgi:hypothetical protein